MSHDDANGRNSGATFLIGFIAGSMLGAGLALLFAPKPGDETRREVAERAQRVKDKAREGLGSASDRVAQFTERGKAIYQTAAEKVVVRFPGGHVVERAAVPANQTLILEAPAS